LIDTVKIFTLVDKDTYNFMNKKMITRIAFDRSLDNAILYEFSSGQVPSYSTSIIVSFADTSKYGLPPKYDNNMILSLECSLHKVIKSQNAYSGFYDFNEVVDTIINLTSDYFDIDLPPVDGWYLNKVDIAICKDLKNNEEVVKYINSLSRCSYPRRKVRFFADECLYISGTTTTLKIYNKLLEFKKNDMRKVAKKGFDVFSHCNIIQGFIRFECSIKKKKLSALYPVRRKADINFVKCSDVLYSDLYNVWSEEFMKLLKLVDSSFEKVWKREDVKNRLLDSYGSRKGMRLYNFYTSLLFDGYDNVKKSSGRSQFYENIKSLKKSGVDFSRGIINSEILTEVENSSSEFTLDNDYRFDIFKLPEVI